MQNFKALFIEETLENIYKRQVKLVDPKILKNNDTLVRVHYSSLNYKDALVYKGHKGIAKHYPTIPGVDAAGVVVKCTNGQFKEGDKVLVTGQDLGMNTPGGLSEFICVPSEWLVPLPEGLSLKQSMIYGTSGMTAAICIQELQQAGIKPVSGKILVTGATGAVGTMAVTMLSKLGYHVIASTRRREQYGFLQFLGAEEIISYEELHKDNKPMQSAKWIGAIDNLGGKTLTQVISSTGMHGAVCAVGLVEDDKFESSIYPFLLRGIKLIGIDSAEKGMEVKYPIWMKLAHHWRPDLLDDMFTEVKLDDVIPELKKILNGENLGKIVVNCIE